MEYKLRLFRSSLCYLSYLPHSCLSYLPYSLYLRLLFNGNESARNRKFLFIDMEQVAILKVDTYVSFFVTNGLFRMDVGVSAHSANIFTTFIFSFSIPSFLRVNIPSFRLIQANFPVSNLSLPALMSRRSCCLSRYEIRRQALKRDLVPQKDFAGVDEKFNLA